MIEKEIPGKKIDERRQEKPSKPAKQTLTSQHYVTLFLRANHHLKDVVLDNVTLSEMNIKATDFENSELSECIFDNVSLEGSNFAKATIIGCAFRKCDMRFMVCSNKFLKDNIFEKCDMRFIHAS